MAAANTDEKQLFLKDLPADPADYGRWRYSVKAAVLAIAGDPVAARAYLLEVEALNLISFDDLSARLDPLLFKLDVKLFSALLQCCRGAAQQKYLEAIEARAAFGCGRQALRILDASHRFDEPSIRSKASAAIVQMSCKDMHGLREYLYKFRLYVVQMGGIAEPLGLELLRNHLGHIRELEAHFALITSQQLVGAATLDGTLVSLEYIVAVYEDKPHKKHAAVAGADKDKQCSYCKKPGHTADMCFSNPASSKFKGKDLTKTGGKAGGKTGKGAGKAGGAKSTEKCSHCGKAGHSADKCWHRPGAAAPGGSPMAHPPGLQSTTAAGAKTTGSSNDSVPPSSAGALQRMNDDPAFQAFLRSKWNCVGYAAANVPVARDE